jgi:MarR family transcriptional regulator, organic hydroperoxide resistance regulator
MAWCPDGDQLDQEIFDAMAEFLGQLLQRGENLAEQFGVPLFCLKALHRLGTSVTMKELGKQMRCDPSFVTMIADTLEERGLARREPNPTDRRLKNLVLTSDGLELKRRLEGALVAQMPWSHALDVKERAHLLELIRKMTNAAAATSTPPSGSERAGEVGDTENAASPAAT